MRIEELEFAAWEEALPDTGFEVFHTAEALSVLSRHAPGELHLLAGFKGDRIAGLFPLVTVDRPVGTAILSPPPGLAIPRLGPLTFPASPKRRSREQVNRQFTDRALETLDSDRRGSLRRFICPLDYRDPRPFMWDGLSVSTAFTYSVDLADRTPDDVLGSFSKGLRREVRNGLDLDVAVSVEGEPAVRAVHRATTERYADQGREYTPSWPYVRDLTRALRDTDRCRTYVARGADGSFLSGVTVLYSNDAGYFWQGGAKATYDGVSVNSLIHWRIIEDILERPPRPSVERYDLMGANTERLCRYKAKFGGELVPYYVVEDRGVPMAVAKWLFRMVRG